LFRKKYSLFLGLILGLVSCERTSNVRTDEGASTEYLAFFYGKITDAVTGEPLKGYTVMSTYTCASSDTLTNGEYFLGTCSIDGSAEVPIPDTVYLELFSKTGYEGTVSFPGSQLRLGDTVRVDLKYRPQLFSDK
jgi:hypothetical protein